MYRISFTTAFKKSYKLMQKRGYDMTLLKQVIKELEQGKELPQKYRNHRLTGNFSGFYECHIRPGWLLIYKIDEDVLILTFVETGTHSDLFNK